MSKILVCLFFFLPFSCLAQFTISGRVLNQANTKALANASVFLSGGTIGDKTSANGSFVLQGVKPGKYELVISIIGFESYHQTIILNDDSIILPDITIIPKTIALNDVSVKPKFDPDRARNLELFEREFLGMSELSKECKILNSELLDLTYNEATNTLTASSVDFLIIENKALGYRIKYLLSAFIMDHVDNSPKIDYANLGVFGNQRGNAADAQKVHFEGSALFENMKGTESQEKRWQKKRQQLYEGSEMHFLRSALTNTTEEEGFRVLRLTVSPNIKKTRLTRALVPFPLNADEIIKPTDQQGIYALGCNNDELHITYNKSHHFPKNGQMTHLDDPENVETTIVSFNIPYVFFDRNGGIVDPNSLSFDGAWAHGRIAELLPVDYEPPQVKNLANDGLVVSSISIAQSDPLKDSLLKIATIADSSIKYRPAEKLYLQFDKPYYAIGDTIWFKAYLFNAPTLGFSTKSGIMYVDIANDSNTFIKQYRLPVKEGITRGDIGLTDFPAGNYTLRAYTNWMRNFDTDGFFYKRFVVADNREQTWLANSKTTTLIADGKLLANVKLRLSDMNKAAVADKPVQLEVMAGNHHLYKQRVQTDANGLLDVNFKVPEKATGLALVAHDEENENKITIPINLNRAEHADVQFLPESGNLVAGLPSHVGFKAIGEDGRGITISGIVTDHNQKQVAALQSLHNGMGSFDLTIQPNEKYTAKVNLPGGTVKEFALPGIKNTGAVLDVKNPFDKDSVAITISATNDLVKAGDSYFLIGKSRGIICYAAIVSFKDGNVSRKVAKQLFPSGITHFILTNAKGQPLNERLVFIDHSDNLNVELSTDKSAYEPHDSISMHIMVTDSIGKPIAGNFSLAVTDDAQVKQDTLNNENIMTRLLLTSDLKGFVEEPGYYLQTKNAKSWQALDNLLLTQGWVNYDWQADKQHPA
ncbi:MAG TPA: carboxypeptidase-like regulatory domain-containing protein, partial [Mucilaginibacter sp.]